MEERKKTLFERLGLKLYLIKMSLRVKIDMFYDRFIWIDPTLPRTLRHDFSKEFRLSLPGVWWSPRLYKAAELVLESSFSVLLLPRFPFVVVERVWRLAVGYGGYPGLVTLAVVNCHAAAVQLFHTITATAADVQAEADEDDRKLAAHYEAEWADGRIPRGYY